MSQTTTTPPVDEKSAVGSKTIWVALLTPIIAGFGSKFGLGLDNQTCAAIAALLTAVAGTIMARISPTPITSFLPK